MAAPCAQGQPSAWRGQGAALSSSGEALARAALWIGRHTRPKTVSPGPKSHSTGR
ncbi:hypothetical protein SLG_36990 [Sphingobium sp. SYK-6]|nr:hypothetical protein SLG_36990 [Sphingobium sp. SYK-6]